MSLNLSYHPQTAESAWEARWQANGINNFDRLSELPVYSIDTPPPTVSGLLHLGSVYSYSQTDFIARFWRMQGYNVFYPMGYDDNGLPTERLVERTRKIKASEVGRRDFIEECLRVSVEAEKDYQALWQRLGLSVDWRYTYRTIDADARRTSQASFIALFRKGLVYRQEAPAIWCPECRTAIAQADLNDLDKTGIFYTLAFHTEADKNLPVATTRPELLPACVAVFVHPQDNRYQGLVGRMLQTPLTGQWVPVLADEHADPEKGTGAVMCCTFGDQVDVEWWRIYHLPLVAVLGSDGRMTEKAGKYAGLTNKEARQAVIEDAKSQGLLLDQMPVNQSVRVHERCDTPVEYQVTDQWFIRLLEFKPQLLAAGEQVKWHPEHMQTRYREWVENLHWDWCISRQRYFGVPFPVWYCKRCGEIQVAPEDQLPVDPLETQPECMCSCGSHEFIPETDVMDTWATSSVSPQIAGRWLTDPDLYSKVFPFSLRPQAHEIIRTWAFYTIAKSIHHFGTLPWKEAAISGWGLAPQGSGKISKSRGGGPMAPMTLIERYSADAVRYWAASTGLGRDSVISEEKVQAGMRLVTKLWNVARFSERFIQNYDLPQAVPALSPADRWILARLQDLVKTATYSFTEYDYATAKNETEAFFWGDLADNYLEMAKQRLYSGSGQEADGARFCLFTILLTLIKLLAPILPFITEEIYLGMFAGQEGKDSIHRSTWPVVDARLLDETASQTGDLLIGIATAVRRYKSDHNLPLGLALDRLQLGCIDPDLGQFLLSSRVDLMSITRATQIEVVPTLEPTFSLLDSAPLPMAVYIKPAL